MSSINAITLKQLRALAAVDARGSITSAADMLNLTVPAVSTQLKQLEANIGAELLIRASDGKGTITRQGIEVLDFLMDCPGEFDPTERGIAKAAHELVADLCWSASFHPCRHRSMTGEKPIRR